MRILKKAIDSNVTLYSIVEIYMKDLHMLYSITQLAKLSRVSTRTLRFYDEIGLLKPALYKDSNYRYYGNEQLLSLQQILFYRELGFALKEIDALVNKKGFDIITALKEHRKKLKNQSHKIKKLIKTIEKTLVHLESNKHMEDKELYVGFNPPKQDEYEYYLNNAYGKHAEDLITQSKKNVSRFTKQDWSVIQHDSNYLYTEITDALKNGCAAESTQVQLLIARHFQLIQKFYQPTAQVYSGLSDLYCEHPDFRMFFANYHLQLPEFLAKSMKYYVKNNIVDNDRSNLAQGNSKVD